MMFRSIRWRIAVPYVVLILIAMLGLTIYVSDQVRQARLDNLQDQLLADARLLSNSMEPLLANGMVNGEIDATAKLWADLLDARVTIIAADGTVLGESHVDRLQMDNHLGRPEVQQALGEGQGGSTRFSRTVGYDMMYAAALVTGGEGQQPLGFVRVSLPLEEIEANVGLLRNTIVSAGLITAFLAAVLALLIAERTAAPVRRLTEVADRMAEGDLEARLLPSSRDEVGQLTRAYNRMADQLRAQVTSLAEEQGRLAAVLDHMADGVLITDENGHVQLINRSAARLFETSEEDALG
ncbi:MAG: HAMP domain-containing protein, partial [Anaerolineae bacterium]